MTSLQHLYLHQLRDIYDAEQQLLSTLPQIVKATTSNKLKQAFDQHLQQTEDHVQRLIQIFDDLNLSPEGKTCEAMRGLITESESTIREYGGEMDVRDAALISIAQKIEHYEIASYGALCTYAEMLSQSSALKLLQITLAEEKQADATLTELALNAINEKALPEQE
jgi:ferritin-like metal-binding protein YciE